MGSVTHLPDRLRPVPLRIASDEAVLVAAAELVAHAEPELALRVEALARSGLLAVSIPFDHGGADVANNVLAQAISRIAEARSDLAQLLVGHYVAMELLRNAGSEAQQRGVYAYAFGGACFHAAVAAESGSEPHTVRDGIGYRLPGDLDIVVHGDPEWIALPVLGSLETRSLALLSRQDAVIATGDPVAPRRWRFSQTHVAADCLLPLHRNAIVLSQAIEALLEGAILLGEKRRALSERRSAPQPDALDRPRDVELGELKVEIETLAALVERAATALDIAQVNGTETSVADAMRTSGALRVTVARASGRQAQDNERLLSSLGKDAASN